MKYSVSRLMEAATTGGVREHLKRSIEAKLAPTYLIIENESHKHPGRGETESHFKCLIVSPVFEGKGTLERHRMVNEAVFINHTLPCHALSLKTMTPSQFETAGASAIENFTTPPCLGGDKPKNKN